MPLRRGQRECDPLLQVPGLLMPAPNAGAAGKERRECPKPRRAPAPLIPRPLVPYHPLGEDKATNSWTHSSPQATDYGLKLKY